MSNNFGVMRRRRKLKRSPIGLFLLILLWSLAMGWGLALVTNAQPTTQILQQKRSVLLMKFPQVIS
jgi:hypothetical protein